MRRLLLVPMVLGTVGVDFGQPAWADSEVLKAVVRANRNNAGIYGAVTRIGRLALGQRIILPAAGRTISERPH